MKQYKSKYKIFDSKSINYLFIDIYISYNNIIKRIVMF